MDGWSTGADPTYLLSIQTCATLPLDNGTAGNTDAFYCNPTYDKLFNKQVTEVDQKQRSQTVAQMQNILYKANADIILYYKNALSAVRTDKVKDYVFGSRNDQGLFPLQNLFINWRTASPGTDATSSSKTGVWVGIGIGLVVILALAATLAVRRRSTARERE